MAGTEQIQMAIKSDRAFLSIVEKYFNASGGVNRPLSGVKLLKGYRASVDASASRHVAEAWLKKTFESGSLIFGVAHVNTR